MSAYNQYNQTSSSRNKSIFPQSTSGWNAIIRPGIQCYFKCRMEISHICFLDSLLQDFVFESV